jgi:TM2 domain-containing membrane protein YozV
MSVDFDRMAAHLPAGQRKQLSREYRHGAKNETTAFLSGFFLGIFGVHHFYLGEWSRGFAHLIIPALAAIAVVAGVLGGLPSLPVAIVVVVLLLAGLIWEIVDLFQIDKKVQARNLALAERLIGAGALADNSTLTDAVARLDSAVTGTAAAGTAGAAVGAITAEDVSAARAMAGEQNNAIMEEYDSSTTKFISDDPNATSPGAPRNWTESGPNEPEASSGAADPSAGDTLDMPAPEYVTHTHTETENSVTDSYQFDRAPDATQPMAKPSTGEAEAATWPDHPPLEEAAGAATLGAGLGAAAITAGPDVTDHHAYIPQARPIADVEGIGAAPPYVTLPEEQPAPSVAANPAQPGYADLPAESYVPPLVPMAGADDVAGLAGAAGMGALASQADEPSTASETTPEAAPTSGPLMKRIRMKRQIVVDGQVVREEIVEKLVPVDTDTTSMVAEMDTELGHASKEEIAHMANLDPDTSLDLRQRTDMPHQSDE